MKLGYVSFNWGLCKPKTFRLKSFSEERFHETVQHNLECLKKTLEWNVDKGLFFFRISSDLIPFASHPENNIVWWKMYSVDLKGIGAYINKKKIRISMHPAQFVILNSPKQEVVDKSIEDLKWHCLLLDTIGLDYSSKIQIHVGGVYGNKDLAISRFLENYKNLLQGIKNRLVIENDDISYSITDVLNISKEIRIPIIFDVFHHEMFNKGMSLKDALIASSKTWKKVDGVLMVDYSTGDTRKHDYSLNINKFKSFITEIKEYIVDIDIMLEIKDKEKSALQALEVIR